MKNEVLDDTKTKWKKIKIKKIFQSSLDYLGGTLGSGLSWMNRVLGLVTALQEIVSLLLCTSPADFSGLRSSSSAFSCRHLQIPVRLFCLSFLHVQLGYFRRQIFL